VGAADHHPPAAASLLLLCSTFLRSARIMGMLLLLLLLLASQECYTLRTILVHSLRRSCRDLLVTAHTGGGSSSNLPSLVSNGHHDLLFFFPLPCTVTPASREQQAAPV
jgi:hypothetical protein